MSPPPKNLPGALLAAVPLSVGLVVASDLTHVLIEAPGADVGFALGATGEIAWALLATAWLPLSLVFAQGAVLAWAARKPEHRRATALCILLLSLGQGGVIFYLLTADTELAGREIVWLMTLGFGVAQAVAFIALGSRPRMRLGAALLFGLASPVIWSVNYVSSPSFYLPSEALTILTLLTALTALALLATNARKRRALLVAGVLAATFWGPAIASSSLRAAARRAVFLHSALGRSLGVRTALAIDGARLRPESARGRELAPDPEGLARFARYSGLPSLPQGFALADHDVVFILSESFRYDETSLSDPSLATTPVLADFASEHLSFRRASAPSNATFPSLAALLCMTTPSFSAIDVPPAFWTGRLRAEAVVAPEIFEDVGYATFWVGHNFQGVFGTALLGLRRRFGEVNLIRIGHDEPSPNDRDIADAAIATIRRHRAAGQRFFGLVFFSAPHDAYRVHDPEQPRERPIDRYRQELRFVDEQIGRVVGELHRDGGEERTVVIISGDHGEAFGEHRFNYHSTTVHSDQFHVPLLVSVPGLGSAEVSTLTSNLYVLPWLLLRGPESAMHAAEKVIREDLAPLFRDTEGAVIVEMVSRRHQRTALRYPSFTVLYDLYGHIARIYDTDADPGEQRDLAPLDPDLRRRFQSGIEGYRSARLAGQRYVFIEPLESR